MTNTIIPGRDTVLNTQYNAIRNDVLTHLHNGTDSGTKIKFSNLEWSDDLAPTGLNNSLEEIDNHIGSIDNHGVATGNGLLGSPNSGLIIQCGYIGLNVGAGDTRTVTITFEKPYISPPIVLVSNYSNLTPSHYISAQIRSRTATSFVAVCSVDWLNYVSGMSGFSWMAIGI